jgi:uncharacterized protein YjbJ (UPF0337 family)
MVSLIKELIFARRRLSHYQINGMNTPDIKKSWNEQYGKLKQKFTIVTDNDLTFGVDNKEEMSGVLQVRWGKPKDELHKIIEEL